MNVVLKSAWLIAAMLAVGCGSSDNSNGTGGTGGGTGTGGSGGGGSSETPCIFPSEVYTGFDGKNTYQAPTIATGAKSVTWTIADPTIADLKPDGTHLMIVSKKAGKTEITATSGSNKSTIPLTVYAYTLQNWQDGQKRYTTAVDDKNPPCASCHSKANGPDHSPTEVDADPDEGVQKSFLEGVDPEGRPIPQPGHMWKVSDSEKVGLVAYLRSLEPRGYPEVDPAHDTQCKPE